MTPEGKDDVTPDTDPRHLDPAGDIAAAFEDGELSSARLADDDRADLEAFVQRAEAGEFVPANPGLEATVRIVRALLGRDVGTRMSDGPPFEFDEGGFIKNDPPENMEAIELVSEIKLCEAHQSGEDVDVLMEYPPVAERRIELLSELFERVERYERLLTFVSRRVTNVAQSQGPQKAVEDVHDVITKEFTEGPADE